MSVTVRAAIMAVGDISIDLDHTPEVYDDLWDQTWSKPRNLYLLVLDSDDNIVYPPFVLRRVDGGEEGLSIGGPSILWEFGVQGVGPTVIDREYFSGVSRLEDGGFEYGELLYWARSEGSTWITSASAHSGSLAAFHSADTDTDDPLANDRPYPARAGEEWTATVWVLRAFGAIGRLHLRLVFAGRFTPADVIVHDWNNVSEFPGDMDESGGVFRVGPNERKQIVINGGAETGTLANWVSYSGTWGPTTTNPRSGAYSFDIGGTAGFRQLVSDSVAGGLDQGYDILPGETYVVGVFIQPGAGADGKAYMHVLLAGVVGGVPNTPIQQIKSIEIENNSVTAGAWNLVAVEVQAPADSVLPYISISLIREGQTTGNFYFDDVAAIRTVGNRGYLAGGTAWIFVPLRTYKWTAKVAATGVVSGNVRLGLTLIGVGRPNLYVESQPHDVRSTDAIMEFAFTPPSGYEYGSPVIIGEDIVGGSFVLTDMHCYDQDTSTVVVDTDSAASGGWSQLSRSFTAPVGTDSVHVEVIGEAGSGGWLADDGTLTRTSVPISTGNDIFADLLINPQTGLPLSIGAGTVNCPETIPYDWHLLNLTNRAALDHYCTVVSVPSREYRLTASNPPLLDVATIAELWPDPGPAAAFLPDDIDVEQIAPPVTDIADRATEIVLIGNEVPLLSGQTRLITATAQVPGPTEYGLNGNPIVRRKPVSDGTVDHIGYAQARAEDLAVQEANPAWAVKVVLSGTDDYGNDRAKLIREGQTVYLFKPDSGIIDTANPVTINGAEVYPRRGRVLELQRDHGPSYRIVMLEPGGATWDLPGVMPSEDDRTQVTVGDRLPQEWTAGRSGDPGGEYLSDRASRPR